MNNSSQNKFVYVTFIRTTPERLWSALTSPEFTRQYWFGMHCESEWKAGSSWQLKFQDGRIADAGEIVEAERSKRLVIKWRNEFKPELKAEGTSLCTIDLEPRDEAVKLTVTHEMDKPGTKFIEAVAEGWPLILSNLKSLLETGEVAMKDKTR